MDLVCDDMHGSWNDKDDEWMDVIYVLILHTRVFCFVCILT
jgi:hypothetical protein